MILIIIYHRIKELVNKHNNILYTVPYQHFTNSIENYFSILKTLLQKLDGLTQKLTHEKLKENLEKVIRDIPKEKYENIFKGTYNRTEKYVNTHQIEKGKLKNTCLKIGVLLATLINVQR